ncbi:MAG: hypothetical protein ACXVKA_10130 [Acidimicrobiia bacterium]
MNIRKKFAALVMAATGLTTMLLGPASPAGAASYWVHDSAAYLSKADQVIWAEWFAGQAAGFAAYCSNTAALDLVGIPYTTASIGSLVRGITGTDACRDATSLAFAARKLFDGAARYGSGGYFRIRVYHEDRTMAFDVCHVQVNVRGNWVIGGGPINPAMQPEVRTATPCWYE